jgi:hypothetical protein
MFTRASHRSPSWARRIHSTRSHTVSSRSILILSFHLFLGVPTGLFPAGFPIKILYAFSFPHALYMPDPSNPPWFDHPNDIWRRVQIMELLTMQLSPSSCHFIPLQSVPFAYCTRPVSFWMFTVRAAQVHFYSLLIERFALMTAWIIYCSVMQPRPIYCKLSRRNGKETGLWNEWTTYKWNPHSHTLWHYNLLIKPSRTAPFKKSHFKTVSIFEI